MFLTRMVLSRTARMDDGLYDRILELVRQKGYDPGRLVKTRPPD